MTDIVEFLTARLRDDEEYALEAAKEFGPDWIEIWSGQIDLSANLPERQPPENRCWDAHVQTNDSRVSRYMVRHDPARVLAEVKAKRRLLARHFADQDGSCVGCGFDSMEERRVEDIDDCPELRDMASVYDSHPGHKQEWKPIVEFVRREDYFSRPPALPPGWAIATQAPDAQEGVNAT